MHDSPLQSMLERIENLSKQQEKVSFGEALDAVGKRTFAPILLLIGLIMLVPGPADIPGVPVALGFVIIAVSGQILFRREHLWVPTWLESRRVNSQQLGKMASWLRKPAKLLDRITKRRYSWLVKHAGAGAISIACIVVASATPILEFIPFSANIAGAAIAAFGLALIAHDGLVAAIALLFSIATFAVVAYNLAI